MKTLSLMFVTALTALAAGATQATALPQIKVRSEIVSYADLDLSQSEDAEILYRRIKSAAHDVCAPPGLIPLGTAQLIRNCAADAIDRALTDVNAPTLEPYRLAKTNRPHKDEQR